MELSKSNDKQLAAIANKAIKEVSYHLRHSSKWVIRLGDGTSESNKKIQESIEKDVLTVLEKERLTIDTSDAEIFNKKWTKRLRDILQKICPDLLLESSLGIGNKGKERGIGVRVPQENSKKEKSTYLLL